MRTSFWLEMEWVASRRWMVSAKLFEESIGVKRTKAIWAAMKKRAEVSAMVVMAARWRFFERRNHAAAGPMRKASTARMAGRRRAAKLGPVRSKRADMERV